MSEVVFNGQVIARSGETVLVEAYRFAPAAVRGQYLHRTRSTSLCPWKGVASYFTVEVDGVADRNAGGRPELGRHVARRARTAGAPGRRGPAAGPNSGRDRPLRRGRARPGPGSGVRGGDHGLLR